MPDNTIARIPVSLKKKDKEDLLRLQQKLENKIKVTLNQDKRLSLAEVMREAIRIALVYA